MRSSVVQFDARSAAQRALVTKAEPRRPRLPKPKSFTSNEALVEELAGYIIADKRGYARIADACGVGSGTIQRIASRETRWPRPTTLFPIIRFYKLAIFLAPESRS